MIKATVVVTDEDLSISFSQDKRTFSFPLLKVPGEILRTLSHELGIYKRPAVCAAGSLLIDENSSLYGWMRNASRTISTSPSNNA